MGPEKTVQFAEGYLLETNYRESQELKTVSYHKLYDILKQHQNEVNEIRTERLARTANPLALKIYKPTNNNLRTSSNTSRANQDNSLRINRGTGYDNQRAVNVAGARENVGNDLLTFSWGHRLSIPFLSARVNNSQSNFALMAKATSSQAWLWHLPEFHNKNSSAYIAKEGKDTKPSTARALDKMACRKDQNRTSGEAARYNAKRRYIKRQSSSISHLVSLATIVRNGENLNNMKEKGDAQMASEQHVSSDPGPQCSTTVLEQDSLSPSPQSQENVPQVAETVTTSNEL
ncbi:hypothetical protein Tco_1448005 [Tanacetum coccineum]